MADQWRVLVVGTGSIGERHVRCFQATGRAEVAICEHLDSRRESVAERYGINETYASLDEAVDGSQSFDVGVVSAPADQHLPIALRLAAADVHLLIEKPLSTNLSDVADLQRVVSKKRLVAGVAYVYRHHPSLEAMRAAVRQGRFGAPVQLVATCGQHFPSFRPAYREIYYADRQTGGGAVQDALTHIINAGQWLVGPVDRLVADAEHQVLPDVSVEDTVHVLTRQGRVLGNYSLNQHQAPNEVTITVICENGAARFEYHENRWRWMKRPNEQWRQEIGESPERDDLFLLQADHFLDAVEQNGPVSCPLQEAVHTLKINLAILSAIDSQTWQDL